MNTTERIAELEAQIDAIRDEAATWHGPYRPNGLTLNYAAARILAITGDRP